MKAYTRTFLAAFFSVITAALLAGSLRAEVTKVDISSKQDGMNGKSWGSVGAGCSVVDSLPLLFSFAR